MSRLHRKKLLKNKNNITTITFSAQIFQELDGAEMRVISTGGRYDEDTLSFQGNLAIDSISKYNVDVAFLSCKGLSFEGGLMDSTEGEAFLKSEMAKRANTVVLLADHTKFDQTAFVNFLSIDKLDYLITDEKPDDKQRAELKMNGFKWAPSVGAWQRQLNLNTIYAANRINFIAPENGQRPTELQPKSPKKNEPER